MKKLYLLLLVVFFATTVNSQSPEEYLKSLESESVATKNDADKTQFVSAIYNLCKEHYLYYDIIFHTTGSNETSVWLNKKVWNNPKDTKKLVESIKLLAENSSLNNYKIFIYGGPSLTYKIAQITIRSTGVEFDYSYTEAKQKSTSVKKLSWKTVGEITVRGQRIYKGLHADTVFEVLTKSDGISEPDIQNDGYGSLIVTHHWKVNNRDIDITFERWDEMYRVSKIKVREYEPIRKKQAKKIKKTLAKRPESCHIYTDCLDYGGCNNFSNCYGACLDDCKRNNCPLCK